MNFFRKQDTQNQSPELANLRNLLQALRESKTVRRPLPGVGIYPPLQQCKGETLTERYAVGLDCDEVYPNIFIGDEGTARSIDYLKALGITHVLNVAEGKCFGQVETSASFYKPAKIMYKGLNIVDLPHIAISEYFDTCSDFISSALKPGGKILVHCLMGMSRSVTIVISYLMIQKNMTAIQALKTVLEKRDVRPNDGFLRQLCELETKLFGAPQPDKIDSSNPAPSSPYPTADNKFVSSASSSSPATISASKQATGSSSSSTPRPITPVLPLNKLTINTSTNKNKPLINTYPTSSSLSPNKAVVSSPVYIPKTSATPNTNPSNPSTPNLSSDSKPSSLLEYSVISFNSNPQSSSNQSSSSNQNTRKSTNNNIPP